MPIWLHLLLMFLFQVTGLWLGIWLLLALYFPNQNLVLIALLVLLGAAAGYLLPHYLFRRWVMARCPECGGRAKCTSGSPLRYECQQCGYVQSTSVFQGPVWALLAAPPNQGDSPTPESVAPPQA